MPEKQKQKGNKGRKIGRNVKKCALYRLEGRREKNKRRRAVAREKKYSKNRVRTAETKT